VYACMHVCMYIRVCTYARTHVCIYYICMYVCMHVRVFVYVNMYTCVCIHTRVHVYARMCVRVCVGLREDACVCMCVGPDMQMNDFKGATADDTPSVPHLRSTIAGNNEMYRL
jgi:hypothetical protein